MIIKQVFKFNTTHLLHEFVPPFTLYLTIDNAQNPVQKRFHMTNIFFKVQFDM